MKKVICISLLTLVTLATSCKKENGIPNNSAPEVKLDEKDLKGYEGIATANPTATDAEVVKPTKITEMTFEKVEHDFGVIKQGDIVNYTFKFKNTGSNDLLITDAKGSCGCTVPEYPKQAVKPGESGKINVTFDSKRKSGQQLKSVTLFTNTAKGKEFLKIKSTVIIK